MEDCAMIDWFVLLVPFAVLPVVLIFGFVGCVLDTEGIPSAPNFSYPPGLPVPVGSVMTLAVSMVVTGADGASDSDSETRTAVTPPPPPALTLKPTGEIITFPKIDLEAIDAEVEGSATCTVTLTIGATTCSSLSATHSNPTADFTLTFTGLGNKCADFTLT
jgi:hypothetical protein